MNIDTYAVLRQVAQEIRQPALQSGKSVEAAEDLKKAVLFLVSEVHVNGDVRLATPAQLAAVLRDCADVVEQKL